MLDFVPCTIIAIFASSRKKIFLINLNLAHDLVGRFLRGLCRGVHRSFEGCSSWSDCVDLTLGRPIEVPPMKMMVPKEKGHLLLHKNRCGTFVNN